MIADYILHQTSVCGGLGTTDYPPPDSTRNDGRTDIVEATFPIDVTTVDPYIEVDTIN